MDGDVNLKTLSTNILDDTSEGQLSTTDIRRNATIGETSSSNSGNTSWAANNLRIKYFKTSRLPGQTMLSTILDFANGSPRLLGNVRENSESRVLTGGT